KVYGQNDPTLTYQLSGLQLGDSASDVFSGSLSRAPGESVAGGPYAIIQGSLAATSNYTISFTSNFLTIDQASLSISVDAQSKIYGQADPTLTYQVSGLQFNDTASGVVSGTLSRDAGETVAGGPYAITQGSLSTDSNYNFTFQGNYLTITPAVLIVTPDN